MFWGISLEIGKRYSQTVEKSFHISMAALMRGSVGQGPVTVMVEVEKASYPICTLEPRKIPQQALDYIFTEGEEVLFYTEGNLDVHLTGYLLDEPSPFEYSSDSDGSASDSNSAGSGDKQQSHKKKGKKLDRDSSDKETLENLVSELDGLNEDNENSVDIWLQRSARSSRKVQTSENFEKESTAPASSLMGMLLENEDSEGSDDGDWIPGGKRKLKKKQKLRNKSKEKKSKQSGDNVEMEGSDSSLSKLNVSKNKQKSSKNKSIGDVEQLKSNEDVSPNKMEDIQHGDNNEMKEVEASRILPGGLIVEELVKGEGKKAKKGRQVSVYYKGWLKKTMKEFDSCLKGKPFVFKLGQGQVIEGWDNGVEGMQVGGKRRLTVPPSLGYGSKAMGASIPANSTLVFVVELLKVH